MEALGCAYGRWMDMVSIAQLAVEGNPQQLEPALFLNIPIQEGELGESCRRMPAGDTHQLRFRWLKGHPPLFPHSSICSSALWRALYESGRESVGRTVAYSVVSSA